MTTRRDLLRNAMLGMAIGGLPLWARAAFAGEVDRPALLLAAYRRAVEQARPLLVFIIPPQEQGWDRGRSLGALLNHGDDSVLSLLAWPVLTCATFEDLRTLLPDHKVSGDPWAVRVDTDVVPATVATLAQAPVLTAAEDFMDWEGQTAALDARLAWLSEAVRDLLLPDAALPLRYRSVLAHTDPDALARIEERLASGSTLRSPELEMYTTAVVAYTVNAPQAHRKVLVTQLAGVARSTWVEDRVPGSWWAQSGGCGMTFEGENDTMRVACGMGHVPEKARRMLHFYGPNT